MVPDPTATNAPDVYFGKGGRIGRHSTRSIGEVHARSPHAGPSPDRFALELG